MALPEHAVRCTVSAKRLLRDEVRASDVTGSLVDKKLLKTSAVSGRWAEPGHFSRCEFTGADVLSDELSVSEVSGQRYRVDQALRSSTSGKQGHLSEFVRCAQTGDVIAPDEAEVCEVTGRLARPGILQACAKSGRRVLPAELSECSVLGQRVLPEHLVKSSVSERLLLKELATQSEGGRWCAASETRRCLWSGRPHHPDDLTMCFLTGIALHRRFATPAGDSRLRPLAEMLEGRLYGDMTAHWSPVAQAVRVVLGGGRCRVHAAVGSADGSHMAFVVEHRTMLGLRTSYAAGIVAVPELGIVGSLHRQRTLRSDATA
jgi:hypothetical protein